MKNIELTEKHKSKLLEICNKLFPENKIQFTDDYYCEWSLFLVSNDDDDEMDVKDKIEIHWFEFCWKILNKIMSNQKEISPIYVHKCILDFGMICFNNSEFQHPIDYLYEIFKQNEKS